MCLTKCSARGVGKALRVPLAAAGCVEATAAPPPPLPLLHQHLISDVHAGLSCSSIPAVLHLPTSSRHAPRPTPTPPKQPIYAGRSTLTALRCPRCHRSLGFLCTLAPRQTLKTVFIRAPPPQGTQGSFSNQSLFRIRQNKINRQINNTLRRE